MQREAPKQKNSSVAAKNRKTGRTVFDKSGRGAWEWQTATGVFEKHISDQQLSRLEASQLMLLDSPPSAPVSSYYEWRESSKISAKPPQPESKSQSQSQSQSQNVPTGPFVRLFKRWVRKS
jgi:hypothetical protein